MSRASLLFVVLASAAAAPVEVAEVSNKTKAVAEFFAGTLFGFFDSDTFPDVESCVTDAEAAYDQTTKAIGEIEQKTAASVKQGIQDLGLALNTLKLAMTDCEAGVADVEKFAAAIEDGFKHPLTFLYHMGKELLVNGKDIYAEITTAVSDFQTGKYTDAGVQVGKALAVILNPAFEAWMLKHGKKYATAEALSAARAAFEANADLVASGHVQASLGVNWILNEFADLHPTQFNQRNGLLASSLPKTTRMHRKSGIALPTSVDWRSQGLVTDVKNQGACGSCWAFSTVVSLEGQHAKSTGNLVALSEQNLVDCVKGVKLPNDTETCCMGCQGGLMDDAFQYLVDKQSGAIDTESAYPYKGRAGTCAFDAANKGATISGWTGIPQGDEDALLDAVANVGPVSIAVDASVGWQLYMGGIKNPLLCSSNPNRMDHGVAIVGYGTEKGKDYWIIRNSWGGAWGEKGYMRIVRGKNACGLANAASYPTGVTAVEA